MQGTAGKNHSTYDRRDSRERNVLEPWRFVLFGALAYIGGTLSSYVDNRKAKTLPAKAVRFIVNKLILLFFLFLASAALVGWEEAVETLKLYLSGDFDNIGLLISTFIGLVIALLIQKWRKK